jgi:glycine/D-amino acid oxidase-like deaminating enzyme/nitrite reductase/ring-hydroxylating ferredoxin subunit
MINKSLWLQGIKTKNCPSLQKDIETDVLIIGGGITGITTAFYLKDEKLDITIIDSDKIGFGVTSKTTGKLTYLQEDILNKIKNMYGINTLKNYIESQKYAIELVKDNIINHNIKCNYESNSSYVFSNDNKTIQKVKDLSKFLDKCNIENKLVTNLPIKYPCKLGVKVNNTAVFHPVKYVFALKDICLNSGIKIYEGTKAIDLDESYDGYIVKTLSNKIKAKKVILACHYPFFLLPGLFPFKTHLEKSYVAAGLTKKNKMFNAISPVKTHSIRYHSNDKDYLIYAGISKQLGQNMDNEKNYNNLFWHMKSNLTKDIKYYWFNCDVMTPDSMPIIGYYEKDNKNILIGTGYNTWGMTNGTLAGKILSDLIKGKENRFTHMFSPARKFNIIKTINITGFNLKSVFTYILSKVKTNYNFYPKNVKIEMRNGQKCGIYIDELGKEHIVSNICPHMKCSLVFNPVDKTWDCPCHGSRFDIDGKAIKGPSVFDISIKSAD